jgi:hypothetical protein
MILICDVALAWGKPEQRWAGCFPAFLHFAHTRRLARSWTHVVATWGRVARSTSCGVWQRKHLISSERWEATSPF